MTLSNFFFYLTNILIYGGVDVLVCLGISQQFGIAGITNFGFIIFQAAGAYTAAILSMPKQSANGGFQHYIGGWNLPFPIPWIGAAIAGGLIALPFVFLVGKRLRGDFAGVGLLLTAVLANTLVTNYRPFLNGDAGLSLVPAPLETIFDSQSVVYQFGYGLLAVVIAYLVYRFVNRLTESPYGRSLRAMRDNDVVADSLGKNLLSLRTAMLLTGGAIAGLSGGILVGFINLWAPSAWVYVETIVMFAAVIIGGLGNHKGAILGAVIVPLGFLELTRFIPPFGPPGLVPALQWVAIGLLIVLFLWFRPRGILPERKRLIAVDADTSATESVAYQVPTSASTGAVPTIEATTTSTILQTHHLLRTFDGVHAVNDLTISIRQGRLTGLIGPNGAGKSTTLAMLAGTLAPTSGQVLYQGQDVTQIPAFKRAQSGLVRTFQLASEFKKLTVMENLLSAVPNHPGDSFLGAMRGKRSWAAKERQAIGEAEAMLTRFGMQVHANTYAGELSGGQRRLVEIMRALMAKPKVLLLDEPMAGVHPNLAHQIGCELISLCNEGLTIVMVEHELAIMDQFCDPVIVMAEGKLLAQGSMSQLRANAEVVEAYLVG